MAMVKASMDQPNVTRYREIFSSQTQFLCKIVDFQGSFTKHADLKNHAVMLEM